MGHGYHILRPEKGKNGYKSRQGIENAVLSHYSPLIDTKLEKLDKQQRQFAKGQQKAERATRTRTD